jgi:DNA-binding transcriptional LysR family regulator
LPDSLQIVDFDSYANVIQAAIEGQGVALGFGQLVEGLIARGSLVRPLDASLNPGHAAYLITPKQTALRPEVTLFVDWIMEEATEAGAGS